MRLKQFLLGMVVFGNSMMALSDDNPWLGVTETDNWIFEAKKGTMFQNRLKDGSRNIGFIGRMRSQKTPSMEFHRWHINSDACKVGMGVLFVSRLDGTPEGKHEFIADGGDATASIADFICSVDKYLAAKNGKK